LFKLVQKIKNRFIAKRKINAMLDCIADISINNKEVITVKLNKDIAILSDQNIILGSHKGIVLKSKTLHLNPDLDVVNSINDNGVKTTMNLIFDDIEANNEFIDIGVDINNARDVCVCDKKEIK
jgi:hypothetical protein